MLGPWTVTEGAILSHLGNKSGVVENDQVADPSAAVHGGQAFMFYDADNNAVGEAYIGGTVAVEERSSN